MEQPEPIVIALPSSEHVSIRVLSRSQPGARDYWDGNWIESEVSFFVGAFRGRFRAALRSEKFDRFRNEVRLLASTLQGVASFTTMEQQIALRLRGDGKGHVSVEGALVDRVGVGNKLSFSFEIDQTFLANIVRSIEGVMKAFPVVGKPDA